MTFTKEEEEKIKAVRAARQREWYQKNKEVLKERRAISDLKMYDQMVAEGRIKA